MAGKKIDGLVIAAVVAGFASLAGYGIWEEFEEDRIARLDCEVHGGNYVAVQPESQQCREMVIAAKR